MNRFSAERKVSLAILTIWLLGQAFLAFPVCFFVEQLIVKCPWLIAKTFLLSVKCNMGSCDAMGKIKSANSIKNVCCSSKHYTRLKTSRYSWDTSACGKICSQIFHGNCFKPYFPMRGIHCQSYVTDSNSSTEGEYENICSSVITVLAFFWFFLQPSAENCSGLSVIHWNLFLCSLALYVCLDVVSRYCQ